MFHSGRLARYIYMRCCGGNGGGDVTALPFPSLATSPSHPLRISFAPAQPYVLSAGGLGPPFPSPVGGIAAATMETTGGYRCSQDVWDYRFPRVKLFRSGVNVLGRERPDITPSLWIKQVSHFFRLDNRFTYTSIYARTQNSEIPRDSHVTMPLR